jgi:hypothetical protein
MGSTMSTLYSIIVNYIKPYEPSLKNEENMSVLDYYEKEIELHRGYSLENSHDDNV